VLPVAATLNQETVRNHLHATADRIESGLGEEPVCLFDGTDQDWEEQPLPDGPITVGIDGGYVRGLHKQGQFEVIAGKSVVAFRREDNDETPSPKCFGFVQTYDEKPRQRLWKLLKSQGMQENQQLVFLYIERSRPQPTNSARASVSSKLTSGTTSSSSPQVSALPMQARRITE
jgi:hypothetical protein